MVRGAILLDLQRDLRVDAILTGSRADYELRYGHTHAWTRDEVSQLIATGRTEVLEGFRGRSGRSFKAWIVVEPNGQAAFRFPDRRKPLSTSDAAARSP